MFADVLVPLPLSLDISGGILHIHLFLSFPFELGLSVLLFPLALALLLGLLEDQLLHTSIFPLVLLALVMDVLPFLLKHVNALLKVILIFDLALEHFSLRLHELADTLRHQVLCAELLIKDLNALTELLFFLVEYASLAAQLALGLSRTVLHIELFLSLGLIDLLLKVEYLLVVLISLLCVLILCALELLVESLDLHVQVLLFVPQLVKLLLGILPPADLPTELGVREVPELRIKVLQCVDEVVFVLLYLLLVAIDIWVVLELSAQRAGGVL